MFSSGALTRFICMHRNINNTTGIQKGFYQQIDQYEGRQLLFVNQKITFPSNE